MTTSPLTRRALLSGAAGLVAGTAATAALPAAAASGATAPFPQFRDRFDRHELGRAWTAFNRAVSVRGGRLHVDGGYLPGAVGRDGWVVTHNGNLGWRNYRIDVQADASNLGGSPRVHMVTLYARVDDTTSGTGRATCYRLDLWAPGLDPRGSGTIPDGLVMLVRSVAGVTEEALFVEASNLRPLANTVSWRLVHGRHRVLVNERTVLDWRDPQPLVHGGVGLGGIWETNPAFDSLSVTGLIPGS